ncbi:MAG: hypothetical protein K6T91_07280 [Firmicutes bacterium]|nr:hypothetical protein [Bacillota bacterium]
MESRNQAHPSYCLSVSMTGFGKDDSQLPFSRRDRFNVLLAELINSHLEKLELTDVFLKSISDGWLLLTNQTGKVSSLCCLATIIASSFKDEISKSIGITKDHVPQLNLGIASGRDRLVEFADRQRDWIGDSARKAKRLALFGNLGEIIIDEEVNREAMAVFSTEAIGLNGQPSGRYKLGHVKTDLAAESLYPDRFIYTLNVIGESEKASAVVQKVEERLLNAISRQDEAKYANIDSWNRLIANISDYSIVLKVLTNIRAAGLSPDVVTYNNLISKASDYNVAVGWLDTMQKESIRPTDATFKIISAKATDYSMAISLLELMKRNSIKPDALIYCNIISKSPDYITAKRWMDMMQKDGVKPTASIYNALIAKSPDYETADLWLGHMLREGIQLNRSTYSAMISKTHVYSAAKYWFEEMLRDGIQPNLAMYNKLLSKTIEYAVARSVLDDMKKEGIQPNIVTYNALITKAHSFEEAKSVLEEMQNEGIQPNTDSYARLFSKNLVGRSAEEILLWYRAQGVGSDEPIQAAMASYRKIGRIDEALRLAVEYPGLQTSRKMIREIMADVLSYLETMQEEGIEASVASYNALISKAPYYDTARAWFEAMRKKGIRPNIVTYNALIEKSPDFDTARAWLELMRAEGIQPNTDNYKALFSKDLSSKPVDKILKWYVSQGHQSDEPMQTAMETYKRSGLTDRALCIALEYPNMQASQRLIREHLESILSYLEVIREEGVKPNIATYSALMSRAPYYNIAESWLETMRKKGVRPNAVAYNTLISKAPDYDSAKVWLDVMLSENIKPTVVTYSVLISKAPDFKTAKSLLNAMRKKGLKPNIVTYNALILKAPDFETIKSILEIMVQDGIRPDINSYNALILKAPNYETAKSLLEAMQRDGIQPNIVSYNRLFSKNLANVSADELLSWYLSKRYHPEEPVQAAIAAYRDAGLIEQALRMALEYPHLQVARKLIRDCRDDALSYFKAASDKHPRHANVDYALGIAYVECGRDKEAEPHLKLALSSAKPGPTRVVIEEYMRKIEREMSQMV